MIEALGGVFLYSDNPKVLAKWYKDMLDLDFEHSDDQTAFYITFPYSEKGNKKKRYSVFSILHNKNRPFVEGKVFTVNIRVRNMEEMISHLKTKRVEVSGPTTQEEGKFAWINDLEGNYLELWEDID